MQLLHRLPAPRLVEFWTRPTSWIRTCGRQISPGGKYDVRNPFRVAH